MLRDDELEDGIAEVLEPLIVEMMPMRFVAETRMSQRLGQQQRVAELVADTFFKRVHPEMKLTNPPPFCQSRAHARAERTNSVLMPARSSADYRRKRARFSSSHRRARR